MQPALYDYPIRLVRYICSSNNAYSSVKFLVQAIAVQYNVDLVAGRVSHGPSNVHYVAGRSVR